MISEQHLTTRKSFFVMRLKHQKTKAIDVFFMICIILIALIAFLILTNYTL
jgi:hypothetical protein